MEGSDHEELMRLRDWRHDEVTPALAATREQLKSHERRLAAMEPRLERMARADDIADAVTERIQASRRGLLTRGEKLGGALVGVAALVGMILQLAHL